MANANFDPFDTVPGIPLRIVMSMFRVPKISKLFDIYVTLRNTEHYVKIAFEIVS